MLLRSRGKLDLWCRIGVLSRIEGDGNAISAPRAEVRRRFGLDDCLCLEIGGNWAGRIVL